MTQPADITLLRQQMLFMGHPLDLAEFGRVSELLKPFTADTLRQCPQAWLRLKPWVEKQWQLTAEPCDFAASPLSPLLWMPTEETRQLAAWLGILAYYPVIRKTLKGDILNALKTELPGCYPEVLRKAQAFSAWQPQLAATVTDAHDLSPLAIRRHGMALMLKFFAMFPPAIRQRWLIRFSVAESDNLPDLCWNADTETTMALLESLKQRTLC